MNEVSDAELSSLAEDATAFSRVYGVLMQKQTTLIHAPLSLSPVKVSKAQFDHVSSLSSNWNKLTDNIARDHKFLQTTLTSVAISDSFTRRLFSIHKSVLELPKHRQQHFNLGILRSDYMVSDDGSFKQVELNTISSAFGSLSTQITQLHKLLVDSSGLQAPQYSILPDNDALDRVSLALASAVIYMDVKADQRKLIQKPQFEQRIKEVQSGSHVCSRVLLMVVQENEGNSVDQRALQFKIWNKFGIKTIRRSLRQLSKEALIDSETGDLIVDNVVIGCVYFRAGYSPSDYGDDDDSDEWNARRMLEHSMAIKCPSVAVQLVGTKKVQQVLTEEHILNQFVPVEVGDRLRSVFVQQWSLDLEDSSPDLIKSVIEEATASPERFVLKPQREGGGNNYYGEELRQQLNQLSSDQLKAFVLMERINAPAQDALFMIDGKPQRIPAAISEFGFFSIYLSDGDRWLVDMPAGHLVRSKKVGVDEGGVASGYAVLNSPMLITP